MKHAILLVSLVIAIGCKDKHSATGADESMTKMVELKDKMCACKDPACAKKVAEEMASWSKAQPSNKPAAVTPEDQKKATELGTQIGECMMKANATTVQAAAPTGSDGSAGSDGSGMQPPAGAQDKPLAPGALPKECDEYKAAVDKLATCEKISKQARETLVKGYADAAAGWAAQPEAARPSLAISCRGGADAVLAVGKKQCGW